jgi:hypothetical protein
MLFREEILTVKDVICKGSFENSTDWVDPMIELFNKDLFHCFDDLDNCKKLILN